MTEYTDPPGMPDDERMTPAELRVVREFLGLSPEWLGAHLGLTSGRSVRHWEAGKFPIPDAVRLEVEDLEERTGEFIGRLVDHLADERDPMLVVYRTDEEYRAADPRSPFPAAWQRAVAARVALKVPGLAIAYPSLGGDVPRVRVTAWPARVAVVAFGGDTARGFGRVVLQRFVDAGLDAEAMPFDRPLKGQMVEARRSGAPYTVVIGIREAESATMQVKDMATERQEQATLDDAVAALTPAGDSARARPIRDGGPQ